ncbi:YmaF family protein [Xylanibacillus composti]|uniref:YmaF family protein n=1 Tax=Xylanibacillus composti TaxID=1572762 RepID=UPI001BCBA768|nr:YmaF family protein [Xylanibacillus composti]
MLLLPPHAHYFFPALTTFTLGHRHRVTFFVYAANGIAGDGHVHRFQGTTDLDAEHFHRITGYTGPAIPLESGAHFHWIQAEAEEEPFQFREGYYKTVLTIPRHSHRFAGPTGTGIGYFPEGW